MGRNIGKLAQPLLGQPVVVNNVPGATGVIAHSQIARAAVDGYTIGIPGLSRLRWHLTSTRAWPTSR